MLRKVSVMCVLLLTVITVVCSNTGELEEGGKKISIEELKGKGTVLHFWASWCPPCQKDMGVYQEATEKYKDINVIMVNVIDGKEETKSKARGYLKKEGYKMKVYYDKGKKVSKEYNVKNIPYTIFIDKEGEKVKELEGELSLKELEEGIRIIRGE